MTENQNIYINALNRAIENVKNEIKNADIDPEILRKKAGEILNLIILERDLDNLENIVKNIIEKDEV